MIINIDNIDSLDIENCDTAVRIKKDLFIPAKLLFYSYPTLRYKDNLPQMKISRFNLDPGLVINSRKYDFLSMNYKYDIITDDFGNLPISCEYNSEISTTCFYGFIGDGFYAIPIRRYVTKFCIKNLKTEKFDFYTSGNLKKMQCSDNNYDKHYWGYYPLYGDEKRNFDAVFYGLYIKNFFAPKCALQECDTFISNAEYIKWIHNKKIYISKKAKEYVKIKVGIDNLGVPFIAGEEAENFDFFEAVIKVKKDKDEEARKVLGKRLSEHCINIIAFITVPSSKIKFAFPYKKTRTLIKYSKKRIFDKMLSKPMYP